MTVDFNYSFNITADTPAVASEVQDNFDDLLVWIKANYRQKDDTPQLTVMPTLPGTPTIDAHAATKAYVDGVIPTGLITEYGGTSAPSGWLLCDGSSYSTTGAQADLFAVIGYTYGGAGASFNVPDMGGYVPVGKSAAGTFSTLGATGGEADWEKIQHNHTSAAHTHPVPNHLHTGSVASDGAHTHTVSGTAASVAGTDYLYTGTVTTTAALGGGLSQPSSLGQVANHTHSVTGTAASNGAHTHTLTMDSSGSTTTTGTAAVIDNDGTATTLTEKNYPPYVVMNYLIKT